MGRWTTADVVWGWQLDDELEALILEATDVAYIDDLDLHSWVGVPTWFQEWVKPADLESKPRGEWSDDDRSRWRQSHDEWKVGPGRPWADIFIAGVSDRDISWRDLGCVVGLPVSERGTGDLIRLDDSMLEPSTQQRQDLAAFWAAKGIDPPVPASAFVVASYG